MSGSSDWRTLERRLLEQGWTVSRTPKGHVRAVPPDPARPMVHYVEGGDWRATRNTLADLRRSGFRDEPERPQRPPSPVRDPAPPPAAEAPMSKLTVIDRRHIDPDTAFEKLKEARQFALLAREMRERAQGELAQAEKNLESAQRELEEAEKGLIKAKQDFDSVFVVSTPKTA